MIPILLNFDQLLHDVELSFANQDLALYNNLLTGINGALPSITLNITEFTALLNDPNEYAFNYIIAENPINIGGAPVSTEAAKSMIQLPDAWITVINLVNAFNADFNTNTVYKYQSQSQHLFDRLSISNIEIDSAIFALTAGYTTALTAKYSIYTTTDKQNSIYALLNDLFNTCAQLKAAGASFTSEYTLRQLGIIDTLNSQTLSFNGTSFISSN